MRQNTSTGFGFPPSARQRASLAAVGSAMDPQSVANGGLVRGTGTGTSDSVKDAVPPGTYIMPADSTQQIGPEKLAGLGFKPGMRAAAKAAPAARLGFKGKGEQAAAEAPAAMERGPGLGFHPRGVPVNLSNGEYKLTPDQVHAIGAQALEGMKDATHTPVARGFRPGMAEPPQQARDELYFADGGLVTDMNKSRPSTPGAGGPAHPAAPASAPRPLATSPSNTYPGNQAEAAGNIYAKSNAELADTFGNMARTSQLAAPFMPGSNTRMVAGQIGNTWDENAGKGFAQAAGATMRGATALIPAAMEDAAGAMARSAEPLVNFGKGFLGIQDGKPAASPAAAPATPPATAVPAQAKPAAPAPSNPNYGNEPNAPVNTASQVAATPTANNVTRDGNSYSGQNIGLGFTINGKEPRTGGYVAQGAGGTSPDVLGILQRESQIRAGMGPLQDQIAFNGGNGIGFRKTSNEEIMRDMLVNGNSRDRATALGFSAGCLDAADRAAQVQQELALRQQDMLGRQGIAAGEFDLKREAQGFQTAAARRQEALQARYDAAKTPEERAQIAQQIRDLSGKEAPKPDYEMAKARMNLVGELGKQYAQLQPIGEDKKPIPFETWAAPFMQAAGMAAVDPRQPVRPMPVVGAVINGHRFRGGNPNDRNSWEKA